MNTYKKYCPNVFVAKCPKKHEKGEEITLTTKRGRQNQHIVHNLVHTDSEHYYYSITRSDGYNAQERAKRKAERRKNWAASADQKSHEAHKRSEKDKDFLKLAEPIKVGHHSEKGHRRMIEEANNNMRKCVELDDKAKEHERKAEYWEKRAKDINLSMPESLEYYQHKLEQAKDFHQKMKSGEIPREHSYSLTYAKKEVNKLKDKYETAVKLWG